MNEETKTNVEEVEEKNCSVCYKTLNLENSLVTTCNHFFCSQCFFRWLGTKNTCPMCRRDLINREIDRMALESYSNELLELVIMGEEIAEKNTLIVREITRLKEERKIVEISVDQYHEREREALNLLAKMGLELDKKRDKIRNINGKIRNLKIKKINMKRKKMRTSGYLNL